MKDKYPKYVKKAVDLGAKEAKIISASSVVTAQWVRLKCQFGCDGYGRRLTCPPFSPSPQETRIMLDEYTHVLLIHGDAYTDIRNIVASLEREVFLDGFYKAFGMGAGPCYLCPRCPKSCKHPDMARPSMEASGIDVYATARGNGFPINVVKTRKCPENYYGIVLLE
jgi:predicted metal-binding protein